MVLFEKLWDSDYLDVSFNLNASYVCPFECNAPVFFSVSLLFKSQNFLSSNGFVHRDLAARNVLLGEDKVVKISDFGLMRKTHEDVYKLKKGKKIPVKWLAPEALYSSEYTTKSDV